MTAAPLPIAPSERTEDSAEHAFRRIREDILNGVLEPGSPISQVRLARELGISRTPLREALNRLIGEGLIRSDFNRRVRVSELDLDDFDQIYAARLALEPVGIRATVGALDAAALAALGANVAAMDEAVEASDIERFRTHHAAFHRGLYARSGARLCRMLHELWDHSERYRLAYLHYEGEGDGGFDVERLAGSQQQHRDMLEAAVAADADRCAAILTEHLSRTFEGVFADAVRTPRPRLMGR